MWRQLENEKPIQAAFLCTLTPIYIFYHNDKRVGIIYKVHDAFGGFNFGTKEKPNYHGEYYQLSVINKKEYKCYTLDTPIENIQKEAIPFIRKGAQSIVDEITKEMESLKNRLKNLADLEKYLSGF